MYQKIKVSLIDVQEGRLRDVDQDWADCLAGMFLETGQKTPIDVVASDKRFTLVAGAHRLTAAGIAKWKEIDARVLDPISVDPDTVYAVKDGDDTRVTIITNGTFDSAAGWTEGDGWTIGSGVATHAAGDAGTLTQSVALTSGKIYRLGFASSVTGGTVTSRLEGGTIVSGGTRDASGSYLDRLTAVAGNDTLSFEANSALNGTVDDVVLFEETDLCVPQGTHNYYLEPINTDGHAGPVTGPLTVTIT